jgi:hypothetical protein
VKTKISNIYVSESLSVLYTLLRLVHLFDQAWHDGREPLWEGSRHSRPPIFFSFIVLKILEHLLFKFDYRKSCFGNPRITIFAYC